MKCSYCKNGLVIEGDAGNGIQRPKKLRCIFCGIEFRKRNRRNNGRQLKI